LPEEAGESAEVIVVAVTEHEGIEISRVNCQQIDVVVEGLGSEAKIHQETAGLAAALGLGIERQAELAYQGPPGRLVGAETPAKVLDIDRSTPPPWQDGELIAVNDDAN
jgi:hypothetical protein